MRWLEVRRHAETKTGGQRIRGSHLAQHGVASARLAGQSMGPFAHVVTGASPRAVETAVAMGFAVDDTVELPSGYLPGRVEHHDQWRWARPYTRYAELLKQESRLAAVADAHRQVWARIVESLPDGSAALVIGHGGGIEPALVACLPHAHHDAWGPPFRPCEGARLTFHDGRFVDIEFHRQGDLTP
jgi:broad specificity phosphatase PhoE